ncbi:MAG: 4-alpha-glucanotransferase [Desulforhopalus sp.]
MTIRRSSGILAHLTSLPSPYGVGDIGPSSYNFIDFLVASEQSWWQFLPTGPTSSIFDNSPYMSTSAFAGSFLLLSPDLLFERGLISRSSLEDHPQFSPHQTDYCNVTKYKKQLLQEAFANFKPLADPTYLEYIEKNPWLHEYALFMTAKKLHGDKGWFDWERGLATRAPAALNDLADTFADSLNYFRFEQFEFARQWRRLRQYAHEKGVQLFGDLPIYVGHDSVDVWAKQDIFTLDSDSLHPARVAGVPPDYFSKTGQRWGNPLYEWQNDDPLIQEQLLSWWRDRLAHLFTLADMVRIDHFRAFESFWSINAEDETAINGRWEKGPGKRFFERIFDDLGPLDIVAEDLGIIGPEVEELRDALGFPGMKVLQFAFDGDADNAFLPWNFHTSNCIVYTGTHDNDTSVGWFLSNRLSDAQRSEIMKSGNKDSPDAQQINHTLMYLAQSSISKLCIFPLQDILGFGGDCKMNSPGVAKGNWRWRCGREFLTPEVAYSLGQSTKRFNRARISEEKVDGQN